MINRSTLIKISATAAFLLLCALIPSWFAPASSPGGNIAIDDPPPIETAQTPAEGFPARAALFNASFVGNEIIGKSFDEEELDPANSQACEELISEILDAIVVDLYPENKNLSAGIDLKTVYGDDGSFMRLVRYFRGWDGDWQNWIDIIIDADTQDIYYIYISSSCLQNHEKYTDLPSHEAMLWLMTSLTASEPRIIGESFDGVDTTLTCVFAERTYDIIGHNYYDNTPSRLFDYKIIGVPDATLMANVVEYDANN